MKKIIQIFLLVLFSVQVLAQQQKITILNDKSGTKLIVNGKPFMVNGMNWDYFPIGTNYSYSLWSQSDDIIKAALDQEMPLLKNMGVNAIRQHIDITPKWIQYIYEKYGIYTMLYDSFGRYGLTVDGVWVPNTDYSDPRTRAVLLEEAKRLVNVYNNTPGLLLYLLGNENNYGLFWQGAETEDIPIENRKSTIQAVHLYKVFNDAAVEMKKLGASCPIAICNGDLLFLDIISKECKDIDILGINCYRGESFGDLFSRVKNEYGKPVLFTEFGSDAYNAVTQKEAQKEQADILLKNWAEIYLNAAGVGNSGNSLGGFTFQFSDGWWKFMQNSNLDVHDTNASWANGGYLFDYLKGANNMNEEWFGICAKGKPDSRGIYEVYPRAAYYVLKDVHRINPYAPNTTTASILNKISEINVMSSVLSARSDKAALQGETTSLLRLSELRGELSAIYSGAKNTTTPKSRPDNPTSFPSSTGFDNMESFYVGVTSKPAENVEAEVTVNILGNVAENTIDEIFYENRGRSRYILDGNGQYVDLGPLERIKLYSVSFDWDGDLFKMNTFFRKPHYHWGYEGDFFGMYQEASYGENMDIYGGEAPFGAEIEGKRMFKGLKLAFGPELWWGANPAILLKYQRSIGKFNFAGVFQYDIAKREGTTTSYAIPLPKNTRASLMVERTLGRFNVALGGLWSGQPLVGRTFQATTQYSNNATVYQDVIKTTDTFGGKLKVTYTGRNFSAYAQGALMGLVASGGADNTLTLTGWRLKDCGSGNMQNALAGFTYQLGNFQIAPNFMWQKPLVGPMPNGINAPGRLRNIIDDPFAVRSNRETLAGELLLTFDPTPATWMYDWENDNNEDAPFAASLDFVYRHLPTSQDAAIGILADGRSTFAFAGSAPAHDLWETNLKVASRVSRDFGIISNVYLGTAQANGDDARLIKRLGADARMMYKKFKLNAFVKFNDWGPYDYHKDFNLTFPFQCEVDLSTNLFKPKWLGPISTCVGIRGAFRTLDKYSPRYVAGYVSDGNGGFVESTDIIGAPHGNEWEIRTYISFSLF
ncbi:glycoside hydrolase family 2 TIM barrel-domain containing protein [Bacteroides caecigallinarum]|uniref:glycoside hydrolase family 2 TIM barrel-domain containing protein n=1 Tax=Bacteroides caecigallinarum TaxID=1411144 RepID=UPI001F3E827A|nr:glycoside hydrolase family 2 TIM barrel-domain containing protein [Bacteroides caecigallinarum]MCF2737967.1 glycosidase [Bacteroides caecigallinarum]MDN0070731.1 glycoside hydrolase family 2 TIM barrel-domain containing protein [Bacteroides caecigallinarum]